MLRYFTIGETADYFGVSVDTIRRWEAEGKITSVRTKGGHRRFLASALAGEEEKERSEVTVTRNSLKIYRKQP